AQRHPPPRELGLGVIGDQLRHAGVDRSRADAVHVHPARAELDRQRARETDHAVLRRGVRRDGAGGADAFRGRDVDDAPLAIAHEMWQAGPDHPRVSVQVDLERRVPGRIEVVHLDRCWDRDARVVDQDVDRAKTIGDVRDDCLDLRVVTDIERPRRGLPARAEDLLGHRGRAFERDVRDRHRRTLVAEEMRGRTSHSTGRAGHDDDTSFYGPASSRQARAHGGGQYPRPVLARYGPGDWAWAVVTATFACIPLGLSLWALLDAAHRPEWAWALAGRGRVVGLAAHLFRSPRLVGGLVISGFYLVSVRPRIAAAENGDIT